MNKLVRLDFPPLAISNGEYDKLSAIDLDNIKSLLNVQDEIYALELKNMLSLFSVATLRSDVRIHAVDQLRYDGDVIYEENRYSPHKVSQESSEII